MSREPCVHSGNGDKSLLFGAAGSVLLHLTLLGLLVIFELGRGSPDSGGMEVFLVGAGTGAALQAGNTETRHVPAESPQARAADPAYRETQPSPSPRRSASRADLAPEKATLWKPVETDAALSPDLRGASERESGTPTAEPVPIAAVSAEGSGDGVAAARAPGRRDGAVPTGTFGDREGPRLLSQIRPAYPSRARRLGKEGRVVLKVLIDEKGTCVNAEVVEKAGFGFDQSALDAVRHSTFLPASRKGERVPSEALLTVRFVLR